MYACGRRAADPCHPSSLLNYVASFIYHNASCVAKYYMHTYKAIMYDIAL